MGASVDTSESVTIYLQLVGSCVSLPNITQIVFEYFNFNPLTWFEVKYTFPIDVVDVNIIEALDIQGDLYLALGGVSNHR